MRLRHLGLPVSDQERSLRFYATYVGFDPATARTYPDGTLIVRNAAAVRALDARLRADDVAVIERADEPDLVSFKCLDPDGWRVEVYWEPS